MRQKVLPFFLLLFLSIPQYSFGAGGSVPGIFILLLSPEASTDIDCNGDLGGTAYIDNCGICVGGNTNETACIQDCNGDWGGTAYIDNCGTCVGGNTNETPCPYDCNGDFNGTAYIDNCGICVGGNTSQTACVQDCNDDWGGTAYIDDCGVCDDNPANDNTTCSQDCNGDWGGTAYVDNCGTCVEGNTSQTACVQDCNDDWGGTAYIDNCGTCVEGNTSQTACIQDCNDVWGGTAYTDDCGVCDDNPANDNTTCSQDCNGDWAGTAYIDICGTCVGGNTNQTACVQDCNGDWGGSAYLDTCRICVGGLTGRDPCPVEIVESGVYNWMDRNLGATQIATSSTDSAAYGDLYQWGRGMDGHEKRTSNTTTSLSTADDPGHDDFILNPNGSQDWRTPRNDTLWQGIDGTNNPCPDGFRLPTRAELEYEVNFSNITNSNDAFLSPLKLTIGGARRAEDGEFKYTDHDGFYWSSTVLGDGAYILQITPHSHFVVGTRRANGTSVRCIQD